MPKPRNKGSKWSLAPVSYRLSDIAGRGVFAKKRFEPGEVIVAYAPKQRRLELADPEATRASAQKVTLVSEGRWVIVPDTSVPGGWLCNHSCSPNAAIYSDGAGRIQCIAPIEPGEEVTIFYGWVTRNEPERDPCLCGAVTCRGFINFDVSDAEARAFESDTPEGEAFRRRLAEYEQFLVSIGQEQVLDFIADGIVRARAKPG